MIYFNPNREFNDMANKIARKDNNNKQITDVVPNSGDEDLPITESRDDLLVRNLFVSDSKYEAAIKSGYSENYAKTRIYAKIRRPEFRKKIIDFAIQNDLLDLPIVARIERKILNAVDKDITKYGKYKAVFKQKKQTTELLKVEGDSKPQPPKVSIQEMKLFWNRWLTDCALWMYRFGKNPNRKGIGNIV